MFDLEETALKGCYLVHPFSSYDERGLFIKIFQSEAFEDKGLCSCFKEQYYSISKKDVIRGMHFQLPPNDHCKLVYCLNGSAVDALLDLRKQSKSYKHYISFELSSDNPILVYIPRGIAHGFLSKSNNTVMIYNVETSYDRKTDAGILWNSFDFNWPCTNPIISERDMNHIALSSFDSPF